MLDFEMRQTLASRVRGCRKRILSEINCLQKSRQRHARLSCEVQAVIGDNM